MPFQGHGVDGYDTLKKKYVGSWVDSMATYLSTFEGTYDRAAKTLTMWTETPGPSGKLMKWRGVTEFKDKDTRIWTAYMPDPQGKEFAAMKITYKRRK